MTGTESRGHGGDIFARSKIAATITSVEIVHRRMGHDNVISDVHARGAERGTGTIEWTRFKP